MDLEERINSLLGQWRDLGNILRASKRERGTTSYRSKSILRKINGDKGVVREVRERECNARAEAIGGLIEYITNEGKDLEIQ